MIRIGNTFYIYPDEVKRLCAGLTSNKQATLALEDGQTIVFVERPYTNQQPQADHNAISDR